MDKLKEETRWFLHNGGHKGFPFLRMYLRTHIQEALKTHTQEEVDRAINEVADAVAGELNLDSWLT